MPLKDLAAHMVGLKPEDPAERKEFVAERTQLSRQISKLLKKKPGFSIKMGAKGYKVLKVSHKKLKPFFDRHLKVDETPAPPNADNLDNLDNPAKEPKIERMVGSNSGSRGPLPEPLEDVPNIIDHQVFTEPP